VQETHPSLYQEICELVPSIASKLSDSLKDSKNSAGAEKKPFANLSNFMSVKAKIGDRSSYRSKSPIGYYSKCSPTEDIETTVNISSKSIKKSDISYNSSKSRSRLKTIGQGTDKSSASKSINLGPKNSAPTLSEVHHSTNPHQSMNTPSSVVGEGKPGAAYSNFLKKLNHIKSSKKNSMDQSKDSDKENMTVFRRGISKFDSNKENDSKMVNLPSLTPKTPANLPSNRSYKSFLVAEKDQLPTDESKLKRSVIKEADNQPVDKLSRLEEFKIPVENTAKKTLQDEIIQDEPLSSKNIFQDIPYIQSNDSLAYKIEALKYYLEKKMGLSTLLAVYQSLVDSSDSEATQAAELPIMTSAQDAFVPFVHHLVFCELNYFQC
jgi:hypothetical protein